MLIERFFVFIEFYFKFLVQNFLLFVKDISDLINKIQVLNVEKGFLFFGSLFVFWDVVVMFFNIDNNLGILVVRKVFDFRKDKFLFMNCIVEVVEICF